MAEKVCGFVVVVRGLTVTTGQVCDGLFMSCSYYY